MKPSRAAVSKRSVKGLKDKRHARRASFKYSRVCHWPQRHLDEVKPRRCKPTAEKTGREGEEIADSRAARVGRETDRVADHVPAKGHWMTRISNLRRRSRSRDDASRTKRGEPRCKPREASRDTSREIQVQAERCKPRYKPREASRDASRERRTKMQAEKGEPRKASRDSSRETQAEMKFGCTAAPNCVLWTELRATARNVTMCSGTLRD